MTPADLPVHTHTVDQITGMVAFPPAVKPPLVYSRLAAGETAAVAAIRAALVTLNLVVDKTTA